MLGINFHQSDTTPTLLSPQKKRATPHELQTTNVSGCDEWCGFGLVDRDIICNYRTNNKQQICVRRNLQFSTTSDSAKLQRLHEWTLFVMFSFPLAFFIFDSYTLHVQHSIHSDGSSYTQTLIATFKHCVEKLIFRD